MQNILSHRLLSTRGGTVVLGAIAALLAAVILLVYLNRYRESVKSSAAPATVLVAKSLIPKGTPGSQIGTKELFQSATLPGDQVKEGALTDPELIRSRVSVSDIYPGQQLTINDFSATATEATATKISGDQRAMAISLDAAHGNIGQLETSDRIDIWASFVVEVNGESKPVVSLLAANVLVMSAPKNPDAGTAEAQRSNIVLRLSSKQSAKLAFAVDNGGLWLALRPRGTATPTRPAYVDLESIVLGLKPIRVKEKAQ